MSIVTSLGRMQRDAIEQLRAGDHSEFLVGFLTTSVLLELSNLAGADLDLDSYTGAVTEVLTQHAPIERCALGFEPLGLPPVAGAVGFDPDSVADVPHIAAHEGAREIREDGVGSGALLAREVAPALEAGGFLDLVAAQIVGGFHRVVDAERARRGAAAQRVQVLVASMDERWGAVEVEQVARAIACLPDARWCRFSAAAPRFADALVSEVGRPGPHVLDRTIEIDSLVLRIELGYMVEPGPAHVDTLDRLVVSMTNGFDRIEQNLRIAAEADTDALTGVGNRRRASKALAQARANADANKQPMSVLLCDLDHFKRVNDTYGHDVGDQVLVSFAGLLQQSVRAYDTVVRWGGEEFLIICPRCDEVGATSLAQRVLRACTEACSGTLPDHDPQTTSIGIAVYPVHASTPEALVGAADDALYRAKREGRNGHRVAQ